MDYYNNTVRDVLHFLDTGEIEHRNTTNTEAMKQFLDELDVQEQINETEFDSATNAVDDFS